VIDAVLATAVTLAARFLSDHLLGDRYFRAAHPEDNLRRCREQLSVARWIEHKREDLGEIVRMVAGGT
jgi:N-acetylhexosamine 1-kinase